MNLQLLSTFTSLTRCVHRLQLISSFSSQYTLRNLKHDAPVPTGFQQSLDELVENAHMSAQDVPKGKHYKNEVMAVYACLPGNIIDVLCLNANRLSSDHWRAVSELYEKNERILLSNHWPTNMLAVLNSKDTIDTCTKSNVVDSLLRYTDEAGIEKLPITIAVLMCTTMASNDSDKEKKTLQYYRDLCAMTNNIISPPLAQFVMRALCQTSQWKECYTILDALKLQGSIPTGLYDHLISGSLLHNDAKALVDAFAKCEEKESIVVASHLTALQNCSSELLSVYLNLLNEYHTLLSDIHALSLANVIQQRSFDSGTWTSTDTRVAIKSSKCHSCGHVLDVPEALITSEEVADLRAMFIETLVANEDDVYLKTTPEELHHFTEYIKHSAPFDCVVDGMNLLLHRSTRYIGQLPGIKFIQNLCERQNKKVLFTYKSHLEKQLVVELERIQLCRNIHLYGTKNSSEDDIFFLLAAFASGPHCQVITRDFLRSESAPLGTKYRKLFRRWQQANHRTLGMEKANSRFYLMPTIPHYVNVQYAKEQGRIHIPYRTRAKNKAHLPVESWICMQKKET